MRVRLSRAQYRDIVRAIQGERIEKVISNIMGLADVGSVVALFKVRVRSEAVLAAIAVIVAFAVSWYVVRNSRRWMGQFETTV